MVNLWRNYLERRANNREETTDPWVRQLHQDVDALWLEHRTLREDFYRHEAVVEERWKTVFNELREFQTTTKEVIKESKIRIDALYRLVLTVSGSAILFLIAEVFRRGL